MIYVRNHEEENRFVYRFEWFSMLYIDYLTTKTNILLFYKWSIFFSLFLVFLIRISFRKLKFRWFSNFSRKIKKITTAANRNGKILVRRREKNIKYTCKIIRFLATSPYIIFNIFARNTITRRKHAEWKISLTIKRPQNHVFVHCLIRGGGCTDTELR